MYLSDVNTPSGRIRARNPALFPRASARTGVFRRDIYEGREGAAAAERRSRRLGPRGLQSGLRLTGRAAPRVAHYGLPDLSNSLPRPRTYVYILIIIPDFEVKRAEPPTPPPPYSLFSRDALRLFWSRARFLIIGDYLIRRSRSSNKFSRKRQNFCWYEYTSLTLTKMFMYLKLCYSSLNHRIIGHSLVNRLMRWNCKKSSAYLPQYWNFIFGLRLLLTSKYPLTLALLFVFWSWSIVQNMDLWRIW